MLKQLVNILDNSVHQEIDIFIPEIDANGVQTNVQSVEQVLEVPIFGGPWGNPDLFKWIDAPDARVIEKAVLSKLQEIKNDFVTSLSTGFVAGGIKMDADMESIQLLKAGYDLTVLVQGTTMDVTDFDNVEHAGLLLADVQTMIIELGTNYAALRTNKNARRTVVNDVVLTKKMTKTKLSTISGA